MHLGEDGESDSDEEYMDAQGDGEDTAAIPTKKFKQFFMGSHSPPDSKYIVLNM